VKKTNNLAKIPSIEVTHKKANNLPLFEKFTVAMDQKFRFTRVAVVRTVNDEWICASCFELFDHESISCCEWCNETNTGDMKDSYAFGCNHCDGMSGWNKDD
jgi:hypothetical protein